MKHSVFNQCFYHYYYYDNKESFNDKEIESLIMLVRAGAGAEVHMRDFSSDFTHFDLSKKCQIELLSLMIEQLLQKGYKSEDITMRVGRCIGSLKDLNSSELVKQVLEARTTTNKDLYKYVSSKVESSIESTIKHTISYWEGIEMSALNPNSGLANKESVGNRRLFGFQGI